MEAHASSLLFMLTYSTPASSSERAWITPVVLPHPLGPSTITYPTVVSSALLILSSRYLRGIIGAQELDSALLDLRSALAALFSIVQGRSCHHFRMPSP